MEIYNQLARQFEDSQLPKDHLIDYKALANEVHRHKQQHQTHLHARLQQLKTYQKQISRHTSASRFSSLSKSCSNRKTLDKQQLSAIDRIDLNKKIEQLQLQIQVIKDKTSQINQELRLFRCKEQEVEILNKRSELEAFNANQALHIHSVQINQEQAKQEDVLRVLRNKRVAIANEIAQLVKVKQMKNALKKKWNRSRQTQIYSFQEIGLDLSELKEKVKIMLKMNKLIAKDQKTTVNEAHISNIEHIINKVELIDYLKQENISLDLNFASKLIQYYHKLDDEFDRHQRANEQMNFNLQSLNATYDKMVQTLENQKNHSKRQTQQNLQQFSLDLQQLQKSLGKKSNLTANFTNKSYFILKRLHSLRQTIISISGQNNINESIALEKGHQILQLYNQKLNKNPEDHKVKWYQCLKKHQDFYQQYIEHNDLLRLFASPENYRHNIDYLSNYQMFMVQSYRTATDFIKKMQNQLRQYFQHYNIKNSHFQSTTHNNFCVQSNDYYRRDNYKLLQKLKKIQLKKKGLLAQVPFNICLQNELTKEQKEKNSYNRIFTPRISLRQQSMKYTGMATRREESGVKSRALINMFEQMNSLRSTRSSRYINFDSLNQSRTLNKHELKKTMRKTRRDPRRTLNTISKQNTQIF